ncbi:transient receptor potential ion channel protein [Rutstroemia sp. NJR-2017a BBW]|nr:transient receptor potential ion channel protein [Rutstroemia sp. NJR-2017a BBW]
MARFTTSTASWSTALISSLAILNTISPAMAADPVYVKGTNSEGQTIRLLDSRTPALFTGDFGDCMGGQSLINVTTFDAAYYKDNMTVLFHLGGKKQSILVCKLMERIDSILLLTRAMQISEGMEIVPNVRDVIDKCSLCPMNSSVPINGEAIIPVSASDVSAIPSIALAIPDFEGSATLRIFSNSTQTEIACFQAVMRNSASFSHPAAVSSVLGVFTAIAVLSSFATAIYGVSVPQIRTHYAHSLSVLVVFEVFQSIFFSGALSVNWPSVCAAFWSNFAWSAGLIYSQSMINSVNSFTGISGNSSQVGGAGSTTINNNGGLQQQIYGRSLEKLHDYSHESFIKRGEEMVKRMASLTKRASNNDTSKGYSWNGTPVDAGLPLPGNWSNFTGTLSEISIPVEDAFLVGFLWYLILIVILVAAAIAFKFMLEAFSKMKWMKEDRLTLFRTHWLGFAALIVLRSMLIAFFMMMTLTLYQFSYGGTTGIIAIAAIIFIIFFLGILGVAFYACYFRLKFGKYASSPDRVHFQRKKVMKILPWYRTVRQSAMDEEEKSKAAGGMPFFRVHYVDGDKERQSVHEDEDYTKRFGWLSSRFRRTRWWFFAFWVVYQFLRACFIGGARANPQAQVFGILVVEVIAFIATIWINPYEGSRNTALAVYMLGISKVATAGLSVAFLPQYNVARIPTTVIGVIIIVIQGFLVVGLLILIVLGAISSYWSIIRNREEKPGAVDKIRMKYFGHIEQKATDLPPPPPPEPAAPEEPKEPYFAVTQVRRAPKIEDEDFVPEMGAGPSNSQHSLPRAGRSRATSMNSHYSGYGNVPYGARVHRASWSSRDFQNWQQDEIARGSSPFAAGRAPSGNHTANNSMSKAPLVRPMESQTSLRSVTPILTSRKYGVATVWLVATLGSKSSTKKITRKAILDVDVQKACATIIEPHAPMALRLQSNLLYGVSMVYGQQVAYVLGDVTAVEQGLRGMGKKGARGKGRLDLEGGGARGRPEQLILMDDPAFDPDMPLPALDLDFGPQNIDINKSLNRDSQTSLSIPSQRGRGSSISSSQGASILGLNISSSVGTGGGNYQLPLNDPFAVSRSSAQKSAGGIGGADGDPFDDEVILFEDDNIFEFDDDGNVRDLTAQDIASRRAASSAVVGARQMGSDSAASARVRKEHEDARARMKFGTGQMEGEGHVYDADGDVNMLYPADDAAMILSSDAEPFSNPNPILPLMSGALPIPSSPLILSSSSASAPLLFRARKPRTKKPLPVDQTQELRNSDLAAWQREYVDTQMALSAAKVVLKEQAKAKGNAWTFVWGAGINGVGVKVGVAGELGGFWGKGLMGVVGGKRKGGGEDGVGRKRMRESPRSLIEDAELPRNGNSQDQDGDNYAQGIQIDNDPFGTPELERARDAQGRELPDYPSSAAAMPWNVSAAKVVSSSVRGASSLRLGMGSMGARGVSASPLVGRGRMGLAEGERDESQVLWGRDDVDDNGLGLGGDLEGSMYSGMGMGFRSDSFDATSMDFEIFGPAANVDTQTAAGSQWVRGVLDVEGENFLEFVRGRVGEIYGEDELAAEEVDEFGGGREVGRERERKVSFEHLFPPNSNSEVVAAQAFLHVLTLATRARIWVMQEEGEEGVRGLGGEIWVGCL